MFAKARKVPATLAAIILTLLCIAVFIYAMFKGYVGNAL